MDSPKQLSPPFSGLWRTGCSALMMKYLNFSIARASVALLGGGTVESFRESILLSSLFLAVVVQVDGPMVEGVEGSEPPPLMLTLLLRAEAVLFCRRFLAVCCCIIGTGRPGGICKGFINAATGSLFSVAGVGGAFPYRISKNIVPSVVPWLVTFYSFVRGRGGRRKRVRKRKNDFPLSFNWMKKSTNKALKSCKRANLHRGSRSTHRESWTSPQDRSSPLPMFDDPVKVIWT